MAGVETFLALLCNYIFIYVSYPSVKYRVQEADKRRRSYSRFPQDKINDW